MGAQLRSSDFSRAEGLSSCAPTPITLHPTALNDVRNSPGVGRAFLLRTGEGYESASPQRREFEEAFDDAHSLNETCARDLFQRQNRREATPATDVPEKATNRETVR